MKPMTRSVARLGPGATAEGGTVVVNGSGPGNDVTSTPPGGNVQIR